MTDILKINENVIPKFPKHVKFRFNKARKEWVILAPERLVKLDPIAVEILQLVDGEKTVKIIASELSKKFNAPEETILTDVKEMLQDLSDKGFIQEKMDDINKTKLKKASEHGIQAPLALLAELSHRCPLQCPYCSNPVQLEKKQVN